MNRIVSAAVFLLALAACGGSEPTLAEYASQIEDVTTAMYGEVDRLTAEMQAGGPPTADELRAAYRLGRWVRDRYTILDLAGDLGLLEPLEAEVLEGML